MSRIIIRWMIYPWHQYAKIIYSTTNIKLVLVHVPRACKKGFLGIFFELNRLTIKTLPIPARNVRNMANQSQNKFIKRKKELERMRKAQEKMERRQGQKNKKTESDVSQVFEQPEESSNNWTSIFHYSSQWQMGRGFALQININ